MLEEIHIDEKDAKIVVRIHFRLKQLAFLINAAPVQKTYQKIHLSVMEDSLVHFFKLFVLQTEFVFTLLYGQKECFVSQDVEPLPLIEAGDS